MAGYPCCCPAGETCNCTGDMPAEVSVTFTSVGSYVGGCSSGECDFWEDTFILTRQTGYGEFSDPLVQPGCWYLWQGSYTCGGGSSTVRLGFAFQPAVMGGLSIVWLNSSVWAFSRDPGGTPACAIDNDLPDLDNRYNVGCDFQGATCHVTAL